MKFFNHWIIDEVEEKFNLRQKETLVPLEEWLNNPETISDSHRQSLLKLRQRLREYVNGWNEVEMKMKFISFLIDMADYDTAKYHTFFDRPLTATIGTEQINGIVDLLIAQGKNVPKHPFFCLHEYKPSIPSSKDPTAQTLVGMVVAQHLNQNSKPVYGICVVGRFWYFMVLDQQDYAVSLAYDATKDGCVPIWGKSFIMQEIVG